LVVSLAPTGQQHVCVEAYESVYSRGIEMLCEGIANRNSSRSLQIIHLSSCGLYGNRNGALTSEQMGLDLNHPVNALLAGAEQQIQSLRSEVVNVCTLRLGGIYGPDREIPEWLVAAAGQCVERNGDHVPCWVHVDDVVQAVNLAAEQKLNTTLNVVDDIKLSKRAITDQLCEAIGCAPVIWMGSTQDDRICMPLSPISRSKTWASSCSTPRCCSGTSSSAPLRSELGAQSPRFINSPIRSQLRCWKPASSLGSKPPTESLAIS